MMSLLRKAAGRVSIFADAQGGNVAIVFALSLIPLTRIAGAAIDYSRGNSAKTDMQAALDATALMLAKDTAVPGETGAQLQGSAQAVFKALFNRPEVTSISITSTYKSTAPATVSVSANGTLNSVFVGGLLGLLGNQGASTMNISASATSTYGSPQTLALNVVFDSSAS